MFKQKDFAKSFGIGLCVLASASLLNGCDEAYDLNNLGGDITIFENGVSAPVGETEKFYLGDFIGENDLLEIDENGRYMISYNGSASTSLSFPSIEVPAMDPEFGKAHLDFYETLRNNPDYSEIVSYIELAAGGSFDHYSSIPEVINPLTGQKIPLMVPEIHAEIPRNLEAFEMDIYDVPEELVSISKITLSDNAAVELSLHAEGLRCTLLTYTQRTALSCGALALVEFLTALAELTELAIKEFILTELTGECTIVEGDDDTCLEAYLVEALLAVAEHPCIVALEGVLEALADGAI